VLSVVCLVVQKVLQIIHEVADVHVHAASRAIQRSLAETMDEVTFALDKASLPRPPALGSLLDVCIRRVPSLLLTKKSRTFQETYEKFSGTVS